MLITTLALMTAPVSALLGDWDLGPSTAALRILERDSTSIAVFFCDRAVLLSTHSCNATVIFNFAYDTANTNFVHNDAATGTYASIEIKAGTSNQLDYSVKDSSGTTQYVGTKIP